MKNVGTNRVKSASAESKNNLSEEKRERPGRSSINNHIPKIPRMQKRGMLK